ncbi:MAG TPA: molybdopterin-dependent oxidoreductase [Acidimicrobiales bacterium]|nr:molybdopterin-dependent oxidoreductase [Acidimicrobiales bacterium]
MDPDPTDQVDALPGGPVEPQERGKPVGRRVVLGMLGLGVAGVLGGARIQDWLSQVLAPVNAADPTGLTQLIPAAGRFRIYSVVGSLPHRSAAEYRLKVDGLVNRPLDLSLTDLEALPPTRLVRDFQCVTGWRVPQVPWTGVTLSQLLDAAGVKSGAKALTFESFDGSYTESLTMDQATRPDVMAAYQMENGRISDAHGGPVRLYVAPMYGYKSCKWLSRISVVSGVEPGYWEQRGYDVDGWVGKSNERHDRPIT